jgi:alkanesulfonate monooxygenase SsuD/methylene tetrahydromethanopterin reductase-like flavin-dependent oxidoreductase (luciferase family)
MRFGINFFPSFLPEQKSGAQHVAECLNLAEYADRLGFASVRIVEHHFKPYGGASPNPIVFLSAASQRAPHVRLVTNAVVPAFNHPLKYAGDVLLYKQRLLPVSRGDESLRTLAEPRTVQ